MKINACKTTKIYCRPNCLPGRRTKLQNRVYFESIEAARVAGYRSCKVCKPDDGEYSVWVSKRESIDPRPDEIVGDQFRDSNGRIDSSRRDRLPMMVDPELATGDGTAVHWASGPYRK